MSARALLTDRSIQAALYLVLALIAALLALCGCDASFDVVIVNRSKTPVVVCSGPWEWHADPCSVHYQGMVHIPRSSLAAPVQYSVYSVDHSLLGSGEAEIASAVDKQGTWRFPWLEVEYAPTEELCDESGLSDVYYVNIENRSRKVITVELGGLGPLEIEPQGLIRVGPLEGSYETFLQPKVASTRDAAKTKTGLLEFSIRPHKIGEPPELIFTFGEVSWPSW